jgi:K+-sensing histidine kinase KdpD
MFARRNHIDKYRHDGCVIPGTYDGGDMSSRSRWAEQWGVWIRAVAKYAASQGAKLSVVAVRTRNLSDEEKGWLGSYAALTHQLGGEFTRLEGRNVAATLAHYISETEATEVVIGHRRRARWRPWDTTSELIRRLAGVDVHILRVREPAV